MADSYCTYVASGRANPVHNAYHDNEYGFATDDEAELFERLVLEINQAGLSWETVLKKRDSFREAYCGFEVDAVAALDEADMERILQNAGVIRNRQKVRAAITNAQAVQKLREQYGSFHGWLQAMGPKTLEEWVKLFRKTFVFMGPEIVREFLVSTGHLPGAHDDECPIYAAVLASGPTWKS